MNIRTYKVVGGYHDGQLVELRAGCVSVNLVENFPPPVTYARDTIRTPDPARDHRYIVRPIVVPGLGAVSVLTPPNWGDLQVVQYLVEKHRG